MPLALKAPIRRNCIYVYMCVYMCELINGGCETFDDDDVYIYMIGSTRNSIYIYA